MKKRRQEEGPSGMGSSKRSHKSKHFIKYGYHGPAELMESRKKKDFFIKPNYQNTLPDVPCEPRHIVMPVNPSNFELPPEEMRPFYEQLVDFSCGVTVDLVGSTLDWKLPENGIVELDSIDKLILEDDSGKEKETETMMKRRKIHKTNVTWLRRTEYISSEPAKFKTQYGEKLEYRVDKVFSKKLKSGESKWEEFAYLRDRKARIKSIENSFKVASTPINEHHVKPDVYAVEVVPLLPDFDLWKHLFIETIFETSPSTSVSLGKIDEIQMNNALLQPLPLSEADDEIERIGYFVPLKKSTKVTTKSSNAEFDDNCEETKEFLLARDYVLKHGIKNASDIFDTCVFMEKQGRMTYCNINSRLNLNRSVKTDSQPSLRGTKLVVTQRCTTQQEMGQWHQRCDGIVLASSTVSK